jgi:hypothetical protein
MKNMKWVGLVAGMALPLLSAYGQTPGAPAPGAPAQAQAAAPVNLSPGAAEVTRLASSGVGDDVVLAYIQNSQAPFNLSADDVLYLKDLGLSPQVTSAMLNHDNTLRGQGQPQQYAPAAPAPAAPPPAAPMAPAPVAQPPPVAAPPPAYVTSPPADVTYFYNDLSPYGSWVNLDGYGWCWQPRAVVVSPGWRPYCDGGYWVYSDAGWYWQSSYSWGWAPFHYGRWYAHPRCGWVWTPDRVWGPAWVTWRVAGDSCGWAPLPPHAEFDVRLGWRFNGGAVGVNFGFGLGASAFAFVSLGDFCSHDIGHHCLPPARVNTVYKQTTIINNYTVVNNNTIVNHGIPIERVSAASRVPVPRATVRELPAGRAVVAERTGSVVYRHPLPAPARPANMVAQKVDAQHPAIQHAPIAPVRTGRPSTFSSGAPAPATTSRQPAVATPKASPWSSGAKPASSPQYQTPQRSYQPAPTAPAAATPKTSTWSSSAKPASSPQFQSAPKTYQPAPTAVPAPAAPRAPEQWKQGSGVMPSYRSDTGLPANYNSRAAVQSTPSSGQTTSQKGNSPMYYPKGYHQAAELRPPSKSEQRPTETAPPSGKGSDSGSRKKSQ